MKERIINAFLIFGLLLSYPLQVIFDTYLIGYVVYFVIIVISILYVYRNFNNIKLISIFDKLLLIFLMLLLFNVVYEFYVFNNYIFVIRLLCIYIGSIIFAYYLSTEISGNKFLFYFNVILCICLVVALEMFYEFFTFTGTTWFEKKNFLYVFNLTGEELPQLMGNINQALRRNGLMDHLHVSSTFIAIGFVISICLYIKENKLKYLYLVTSIILAVALIITGVRLSLVSTLIWFLFFFIFYFDLRKHIYFFLLCTLLVLSLVFYITYENKIYFWNVIYLQYLPAYISEIFNNSNQINQMIIENDSVNYLMDAKISTVNNSMLSNIDLFHFIFGVGLGNLAIEYSTINDDFFFLQFFYQLGLLNALILTAMVVITFKTLFINIFKDEYFVMYLGILMIILFSVLHSGIIIRKQIWFLFFLFIFLVNKDNMQRFDSKKEGK